MFNNSVGGTEVAIKWNETLAVGVRDIDEQHKELFSRVNQLLEACSQGKGKEEVRVIISFMESYVVEHFQAEEKLQRASAYPLYEQHKAMHAECLRNVSQLKEKLEQQGPTLPFVIQVNRVVVDWLTSHIGKVDKELGQYLKHK